MNSFKFLIKCIANNEEFYAEKQNLATDSGLDLVFPETIIVPPNARSFKIPLGVCVEYPEGYYLYARSSIAKTPLVFANSVGIIDSGYRGEILAKFKTNTNVVPAVYKENERIMQMMILPYPEIEFAEVKELNESDRNAEGFGSTGNETNKKNQVNTCN